jgi:FKBP-type peptidyl-prolyl cis-trans isomerase
MSDTPANGSRQPPMAMIKPGVELLSESLGDGPVVVRHKHYQVRLRMWLSRGEPVVWDKSLYNRVEEDGVTRISDVHVHRGRLIAGLFYGMQGMHVGGTRTLRIAPHLAYGEQGVPGVIAANALLTIEVTVLSHRSDMDY